jgi:hypothetical protein
VLNARSVFFTSALLFWINTTTAQAQSKRELTAIRRTPMPVSIHHNTYTTWSGGALLFVEDRVSGAPVVHVIDKENRELSRFTLAIPEASRIMILDHSIARGSDGLVAIVGLANSTDSRGTRFLALVAPDAAKQTLVQLSPFAAETVTVAADGTIWVAGGVPAERGAKAETDQFLVRRYSPAGQLLSSLVKWSDVSARDRGSSPALYSNLLSSKGRIGWYLPAVQSYMEFSLDGKVMTQIKSWSSLGEHAFDSPVLCDDGSVFVAEELPGKNERPQKNGMFTLNRDTGTWDFAPREQFTELLGCDETSVPAFSPHVTELTWFEVTEQHK